MPLYSHRCNACGKNEDRFLKIADLDFPQFCSCTGLMDRLVSAPMVQTDITPYISPATGKVISTRRALRSDLKESGCFIAEAGTKKQIESNRKRALVELDTKWEARVSETVGALRASGRI